MSKSNRISDYSFVLSNTAMLFLRTTLLDYEVAAIFNNTFQLSFARQQDFEEYDSYPYPFFCFFDEAKHLIYVLINNVPNDCDGLYAMQPNYNKLLFINGRDAFDMMRRIQHDLWTDPQSSTPTLFDAAAAPVSISPVARYFFGQQYLDLRGDSPEQSPLTTPKMKTTDFKKMKTTMKTLLEYIENHIFIMQSRQTDTIL